MGLVKLRNIALCIAMMAPGWSCLRDQPQSRNVALSDFSYIVLNSPFEVFLNDSAGFHGMLIEADKKVIDGVKWQISDGTLTVENTTPLKWTRPGRQRVRLTISAEHLDRLTANETCFIRTVHPIRSREFGLVLGSKANAADLELANHTFYYWNQFPCGGRLTLSGHTDVLKIWNFALMTVDATTVEVPVAIVENNAKSDCMVRVSDRIDYNITGNGNIHLYGDANARITGTMSGSGNLIRH